jgi:hypothetical protein
MRNKSDRVDMNDLCDDEHVRPYKNRDLKYVQDWDFCSKAAAAEK